jgi:hypothetical protein
MKYFRPALKYFGTFGVRKHRIPRLTSERALNLAPQTP